MQVSEPVRELQAIAAELNVPITSEKLPDELDNRDELKSFRDEFYFPINKQDPNKKSLYFCGNSLGLQPKNVRVYLQQELDNWAERGVEGHHEHSQGRPWINTDEFVTPQMTKVVGGEEGEVVVMNSLSANLHLMMVSFYQPTATRHKILIEQGAFPSDLYIVNSQIEFHGYKPEESLIAVGPRHTASAAAPNTGDATIRTEDVLDILQKHGKEIALVLLPGIQYYTGQLFDMERITAAAHEQGCFVGFDLAHAAGNVPLQLHKWGVDFACWCTYKYLNSGPGNIAGAFVHSRHANNPNLPRFAGWWGHNLEGRFGMRDQKFVPVSGAFGWRLSNPPVVCIAPLLASLELFEKAGMDRLRAKSLLLTAYLEQLLNTLVAPAATQQQQPVLRVITPQDVNARGAQLSLLFFCDVALISDYLKNHGVICDVRKPNVLRVAPAPLYNSFRDVYEFVQLLQQALTETQPAASTPSPKAVVANEGQTTPAST